MLSLSTQTETEPSQTDYWINMNHSGPQPMDDERPEPGISLSQHDGEKKEEAIHGNITHSEVGDVGLPVVDELAANQVPPEEYRKVLRKIDKHLMPMLCLIYGIQFVTLSTTCQGQSRITDCSIEPVGQNESRQCFYHGTSTGLKAVRKSVFNHFGQRCVPHAL